MATLSGGAALERKLAEIAAKAGKSGTLQVGFLAGSTYPDGTPVAAIAFINEYGRTVRTKEGSYYQLPRPYFRTMIAEKSPKWGANLGRLAVLHDYDIQKVLTLMGEGITAQLQASIRTLVSPPLAPTTIKAKGFSKPLIDTATMLNSVGYTVTSEGTVTGGTGAQMSGAASSAMRAAG